MTNIDKMGRQKREIIAVKSKQKLSSGFVQHIPRSLFFKDQRVVSAISTLFEIIVDPRCYGALSTREMIVGIHCC